MATSDNSTTPPDDRAPPQEKKAKRAGPAGTSGAQRQAERLARSLGESAQNIWLAGIGALGRAQSGGSRLFASLVEEGEQLQRQTRASAGDRAAEAAEAVGQGVDEVRGFAEGAWERWEKGFDERMQRALARLGVPTREDVLALERQVEALRTELRRERAANAERRTAARPAPGSATQQAPAASPDAGEGAGSPDGSAHRPGAGPSPGPASGASD